MKDLNNLLECFESMNFNRQQEKYLTSLKNRLIDYHEQKLELATAEAYNKGWNDAINYSNSKTSFSDPRLLQE